MLVLRLDEEQDTATLERSYEHPRKLFSETQANAQFLPNGHVLVGWGQQPYVTEFDRGGEAVFDLRFGGKGADSYRAYRAEWTGAPGRRPGARRHPRGRRGHGLRELERRHGGRELAARGRARTRSGSTRRHRAGGQASRRS